MDNPFTWHVVHAIHMIHFALIGFLGILLLFFNVGLGVRQMTRPRGISSTDRALLKVSLEDITARKRIAAQDTHVWSVAGVTKEMSLQVFRMKVGLGAVGAREFAIRIFLGNHGALGGAATRRRGRPTRGTGEDTASSLRSNHMRGLFIVMENGLLMGHHGTATVRRRQPLLGHHPTRWHGPQDRRTRSGWSGSYRLRVRGSD